MRNPSHVISTVRPGCRSNLAVHEPASAPGSGVVAPALTHTFNDAVSLLGVIYLPYGQAPAGGALRSEYGAAPLSGLLQLRVYF